MVEQTAQQIALAWIGGLVPAMSAVVGGVWIAYTYLRNQREAHEDHARQAQSDAVSRSIEARKPFLARQLEIYFETAEIVGKLVTISNFEDPEWVRSRARYSQLFWTVLSLVEDADVKAGMEEFVAQLRLIEGPLEGQSKSFEEGFHELQQSGYRLARHLRKSLENSWVVGSGLVVAEIQ
jgi:hypothetical protein